MREAGPTFRSYYDSRGELKAALEQYSYPDYWIFDADGRIRFEHARLTEIRRQVSALLDSPPEG